MEKTRRPWIGFIGMVLLIIGVCAAYNGSGGIGNSLAMGGVVFLVYALLTGDIKLFG